MLLAEKNRSTQDNNPFLQPFILNSVALNHGPRGAMLATNVISIIPINVMLRTQLCILQFRIYTLRLVLLLTIPCNVRFWLSPLSDGLHNWGGCVPLTLVRAGRRQPGTAICNARTAQPRDPATPLNQNKICPIQLCKRENVLSATDSLSFFYSVTPR